MTPKEERKKPVPETCPMCKQANHKVLDCQDLKKLDPDQRLEMAYKWVYHFGCLTNHKRDQCPEAGRKCGVDSWVVNIIRCCMELNTGRISARILQNSGTGDQKRSLLRRRKRMKKQVLTSWPSRRKATRVLSVQRFTLDIV